MSLDSMKNWGFLTIVEHQRLGLIGGYLVLNSLGRPVEFHCTTPVRANRAQEILYGPTLDAFLYGEQIAQILITRAKIKPYAVLTDQTQVLAVQEFVEMPVSYIKNEVHTCEKQIRIYGSGTFDSSGGNGRVMANIASVPGLSPYRWSEQSVGRYTLTVPELTVRSTISTVDELKTVATAIDFHEPFERIRLAIEEAQKAA